MPDREAEGAEGVAPEVAALRQRGRFGARGRGGFQFQDSDVVLEAPVGQPRGQALVRGQEGEVQGDLAGRRFRRIVGQTEGEGHHVRAGEHRPLPRQEPRAD
jgi:hypothetical protein